MQEQGFKFDAILPFLLDMDMDSSNDRASELLTGNDCALQDICYVHEPLVIYPKKPKNLVLQGEDVRRQFQA